MNKYKRLYLLLFCFLVLLNGFFWEGSIKVFAYENEDNFYNIDCPLYIQIYDSSDNYLYKENVSISSDNVYHLNNNQLNNIYRIVFVPNFLQENTPEWTFPYNFEKYDYYLLGAVTAICSDNNLSTFKPTLVDITYYDVTDSTTKSYNTSNLDIYDIDSVFYKGFGFSEKVDFDLAGNIGIRHISLNSDIHGSGNKPSNICVELGIMAIEKGTSAEVALSKILAQLEKMEVSINNSINDAANDITNSIEDQYSVSEEENFGVDDIVDQVNEKAGVLSFGTDTLVNFLDLFDAANATNTQLTFPGFSMEVQGVTYQVWPDYHYDLSELENQFGALIEVVRWGCVMAVWLAVLNYLVKAYDSIFGR